MRLIKTNEAPTQEYIERHALFVEVVANFLDARMHNLLQQKRPDADQVHIIHRFLSELEMDYDTKVSKLILKELERLGTLQRWERKNTPSGHR